MAALLLAWVQSIGENPIFIVTNLFDYDRLRSVLNLGLKLDLRVFPPRLCWLLDLLSAHVKSMGVSKQQTFLDTTWRDRLLALVVLSVPQESDLRDDRIARLAHLWPTSLVGLADFRLLLYLLCKEHRCFSIFPDTAILDTLAQSWLAFVIVDRCDYPRVLLGHHRFIFDP